MLFDELRRCQAVVFLNSRAGQVSMWCHSELAVAIELGRRIYSLDLDLDLPPHPLLHSLQGIRLDSTIDASVQRLADSLAADGLAGHPLLQRLARREIERANRFVRLLPAGREIAYDGEDREWLLGLTQEARSSIDAVSLFVVDSGMLGSDGGLWVSDLGTRYLDLQREAIGRQVSIRRVFVVENDDLAPDVTFLKIIQMQRDIGVGVRILDHQLIPGWLQARIFDFVVFDGALSYETTPATTFSAAGSRPTIVRTLLAPMPERVRDLKHAFEQLWTAADPERQIGQ